MLVHCRFHEDRLLRCLFILSSAGSIRAARWSVVGCCIFLLSANSIDHLKHTDTSAFSTRLCLWRFLRFYSLIYLLVYTLWIAAAGMFEIVTPNLSYLSSDTHVTQSVPRWNATRGQTVHLYQVPHAVAMVTGVGGTLVNWRGNFEQVVHLLLHSVIPHTGDIYFRSSVAVGSASVSVSSRSASVCVFSFLWCKVAKLGSLPLYSCLFWFVCCCCFFLFISSA